MKRIEKALATNKKILSVFFTAGHPEPGHIKSLCEMLEKAGVGMIEIGIPCSDPLADGPVIQQSSSVALNRGMSLTRLFEELSGIRKTVTIPLLLMGYYNQVLQYGEKKFVNKAVACGMDGFIIPDQPEVCLLSEESQSADLANVRLICPTTSTERIKQLDSLSSGFLYAVSSSSTTGNTLVNHAYTSELEKHGLKNPLITGFGIKDRKSFEEATSFTKGGIVGSAFVDYISDVNRIKQQHINTFIQQFI